MLLEIRTPPVCRPRQTTANTQAFDLDRGISVQMYSDTAYPERQTKVAQLCNALALIGPAVIPGALQSIATLLYVFVHPLHPLAW